MRARPRLVLPLLTVLLLLGPAEASLAKPAAPKLVDRAVSAGGSLSIRRPRGHVPGYVLSPSRKRPRHARALRVAKRKTTLLLTIPRSTASGSYRLLACRGRTCAEAKRKLAVAPPLTHLRKKLRVKVRPAGAMARKPIAAATGGSLTATGPGGTKYTLTIPKNTLPDDTTVTMQPLSSVAGLGKRVASEGVRFGPNGLQLRGAAALTVRTKKRRGRHTLVTAFSTPDSRAGVALVPARHRGSTYTVPVPHFSSWGLVGASSARLDAIALHQAASAADQLGSQAYDAFARGDQAEGMAVIARSGDPYFNEVVRPLIEDGLERNSFSSLDEGYRYALAYVRELEILGASENELQDLAAMGFDGTLVAYLLELGMDRAYRDCAESHDLATGAREILGAERSGLFVGGLDTVHIENAEAAINHCYKFRLDFDSDVSSTSRDGAGDQHVAASVPVRGAVNLYDQDMTFEGSGALGYLAASGHTHDTQACGESTVDDYTDIVGSTGSTMTLSSMRLEFTGNPVRIASLALDPGQPTESVRHHGEACVSDSDVGPYDFVNPEPGWLFGWGTFLHHDEATSHGDDGSGGPWTFTGFTPGSGALIGTKKYDRSEPFVNSDEGLDTTLTEHTAITLTHTPDPTPALPPKPKVPPRRGR